MHLHASFKHIFILWLLHKNHSQGTSEAFSQFGRGVILQSHFSFGCYFLGIWFSTLFAKTVYGDKTFIQT